MSSELENTDYRALLADAYLQLRDTRRELEELKRTQHEPIAIIGMGCRFPGGADTLAAYWRLLHDGVDAITEIPGDRWDVDRYYAADRDEPGKMYVREGGFLNDVDKFDAGFFGISPREAAGLDPQQRLLLEVTWEALEDAAEPAAEFQGSQTGVFTGLFMGDYAQFGFHSGDADRIDAYNCTGNLRSLAAGRIAYTFGLHGPAIQLDTACSSSLVAIHLACQSLRRGECDRALAGGVNLILTPDATIGVCRLGALSADGRCKTFSADADGYGRGEGCGVVVLRRLSDAIARGNRIHAVIRGSAVNHDGRSNGLTAPNGQAQEDVVRRALNDANVEPKLVQYVEAHGTGTLLGDPIEVQALGEVLSEGRDENDPLILGSVKTNFGHLEAAAGVAGVIKTVLALHHRVIPKHLNFAGPNPHIPWQSIPVRVATEISSWPKASQAPLAGVSAFGMSGTNAHLILEAAPEVAAPVNAIERPRHLLCLSARSERALTQLVERYEDHLTTNGNLSLADVCFTASQGRKHFNHRLAITAGSNEELLERLRDQRAGRGEAAAAKGIATPQNEPRIAFLFTGQGSQYVGMGKELYETQPIFREALDRCHELLKAHLSRPLRDVIFGKNGAESLLDETEYTQPALFALEYALAEMWQTWGIRPWAVMGHSIGEYVAACVAGVFSLEEGLRLIAARGRLMQRLARDGGMATVFAEEKRVKAAISRYGNDIGVAAINGPVNTVISGRATVVDEVCRELSESRIKSRALRVSHAFHSSLIEPMLEEFRREAALVSYKAPQLMVVSNLTGEAAGAEMRSADYWVRHAREAVRFTAGMKTLVREGVKACLEIGPKPMLTRMASEEQEVTESGIEMWSSVDGRRGDWEVLGETLGRMYVRGVEIDWKGYEKGYSRRRIGLPGYPFERQRYWIESERGTREGTTDSDRRDVKEHDRTQEAIANIFELKWAAHELTADNDRTRGMLGSDSSNPKSKIQNPKSTCGLWLILSDSTNVGKELGVRLEARGDQVSFVHSGATFEARTSEFTIDQSCSDDYQKVIEAASGKGVPLRGIVNLWGLDSPDAALLTADQLTESSRRVCESSISLIKAAAHSRLSRPTRVWLVTRQAQAVIPGDSVGGLVQSCLWGFGRVAALEHSELRCSLVDLAGSSSVEDADCLFNEVWSDDAQLITAYRDGKRHVARLKRLEDVEAGPEQLSRPDQSNYFLAPGLQRQLAAMRLEPASRRRPDHGEVEVEVRAAGLNFRDVLNAMGLYPGKAGALGGECAGVVAAVGDGVTGFKEGDPVIVMALGSLRKYLTIEATLVRRMPGGLSYEGAATIPVAFLTAFYALHDLAKLQRGDRLLIHAATGGVGLAAVQIAKQCGAEIFATASPAKWDKLRALGIDHIHNSRTPGFAGEILEATAGEGVDVVLNSLSGESIADSLKALGINGRFVEIGKRGVWSAGEVALVRPEAQYFRLDLVEEAETKPDLIGERFEEILSMFERGTLKPLPLTVFPIEESPAAFRLMQQAKHIGKVALTLPVSNTNQLRFNPNSTYLVTGGLGGLGLTVARWMVEHGVRSLVLVSRRGRAAEHEPTLMSLESMGAVVRVMQADVSQEADVVRVVDDISREMAPLGGVIHAAGVLDDGIIQKQTWARFEPVFAAKAIGAWHLHRHTMSSNLEFFVMFSSAASLRGTRGQSNYAAANSFLDGLAHYRRSRGLPALAINWGPWADVGMAARIGERMRNSASASGVAPLSIDSALRSLEYLLLHQPRQAEVIKLSKRDEGEGTGRHEGTQPVEERFAEVLRRMPTGERRVALMSYLRTQVSNVLGTKSIEQVQPRQSLFDLGIDSLMTIELKNVLEAGLDISLSPTFVFDYPTIEVMARHLVPEETVEEEDELDTLTESEAEDRLLEELERLNY